MSEFLVKLQSYDLFTLQARIYEKLLTFAHSILLSENAPAILKEKLSADIAKNDETVQAPVQAFYELRKGEKIKNIVPDTKFEWLTFKSFFQRLLGIFRNYKYTLNKDAFKSQINLEIGKNLKIFLKNFHEFDVKYSNFSQKVTKRK